MILDLLLCLCASPLLPATQAWAPQAPPPAPAPSQALAATDITNRCRRVHVVGASMSAGFGLMQELGASASIADFLKFALGENCEVLESYGDTRFFQQPDGFGQKQIQKSLHSDPTLVIAVDFAFWYGYGYMPDCETRLERLEVCLKELERVPGPLLVGDFPDMSPALLGSSLLRQGKPMLDPRQIPDEACLEQLNARLVEWATGRTNVRLFPLSFFVREVALERTFEFRGIEYDQAAKQQMLQSDLLHPTVKGTAAATLFILHQLAEAKWLDPETIQWDPAALERAVLESTKAARDEAAERKRKRAERKAQREADKEKQNGEQPPLVSVAD